MSAKLKKAWRFWRDGCIPVDYPAGSVIEGEIELKYARDCGVLEDETPEEEPKKKAKKKKEE